MAIQDDQGSGHTIELVDGVPSAPLSLTTTQMQLTMVVQIPDKVKVMALGRVTGSAIVPNPATPGTPRRWGPFVWEIVPLASEYVFTSVGADVEIEVSFGTGYRSNRGKIS